MNWISTDKEKPKGECLVYMESPHLGSNLGFGNFKDNVSFINGRFAFDMPKVLLWCKVKIPLKVLEAREFLKATGVYNNDGSLTENYRDKNA